MKNEDIKDEFQNELGFNEYYGKDFLIFFKENSALSDQDFYNKLHEQFPWISLSIQLKKLKHLRYIRNYLGFFTILIIISIIVALIGIFIR